MRRFKSAGQAQPLSLRDHRVALPSRPTFVFKGGLSRSDEVKICRLERGELRSGDSLEQTIGLPGRIGFLSSSG
jgi:hypothetical protein